MQKAEIGGEKFQSQKLVKKKFQIENCYKKIMLENSAKLFLR